jgi:anthranilate phosphoribosyltransferase
MIREAIGALAEGRDLTEAEVAGCVSAIASGEATQAQAGAFLTALRLKGETVEEIAAFATALRELAVRIKPAVSGRLIDTCGTGGDGSMSFNVSTVSAIVAAGAGACVAKHGNRSVTSRCGSADLLEQLGFNLGVSPERVRESVEKAGIGFMFAPTFHPAMRSVAQVRREIGIRTVFNVMGPLTNPAGADAQVVGVYSPSLAPKMAEVLRRLGTREAIVVHGMEEGIDEISAKGRTLVSWLRDGEVTTREYTPEELGVEGRAEGSMAVSCPEHAAKLALELLSCGRVKSIVTETVLVNSAAALVVSGRAESFVEGVEMARESVRSGSALKKLEQLVKLSGGSLERLEANEARS